MREISLGQLLKSYRNQLGWTQPKIAEALKIGLRTYQKWENEESIPSEKWLLRLADLFELTSAEADVFFRAAAQPGPEIHNLPFLPNPFFTGREAHLEQLNHYFKENNSVALTQPVGVSGLGGIGKTQLALEYAHRCYRKEYRTVLWVNAADKTTLEKGYRDLADLLKLIEEDESLTKNTIPVVKAWLERHTDWLLILDSADDLEVVRSFLPTTPRGHILFTTQSQILGDITKKKIDVEAMNSEEGRLFLLRRSKVLKSSVELETIPPDMLASAKQLVAILGGHPLALDQAGAYIEGTGASFAEYIHLYSDQHLTLLKRRGGLGGMHPETVVVTFELSFQQACQLHPLAADVMRMCAFLYPDSIPEELVSACLQGDRIRLNDAIEALRRYSLVLHNTDTKSFTIHRLVQIVTQENLDEEEQRMGIRCVIEAVNATFPFIKVYEHRSWPESSKRSMYFKRFLMHILNCCVWIGRYDLASPGAVLMLSNAGCCLHEYLQSEKTEEVLLTKALEMARQLFGDEHPHTAATLYNLAWCYLDQGRKSEAESFIKQELHIYGWDLETMSQPSHSARYVAAPLRLLAGISAEKQDAEATAFKEQAMTLWGHALFIQEQAQTGAYPTTATTLKDLMWLTYENGDERASHEILKVMWFSLGLVVPGDEHRMIECAYKSKILPPLIAVEHYDLAQHCHDQGLYIEAEEHYKEALRICEDLGPQHFQNVKTIHVYSAMLRELERENEAAALEATIKHE